MKTFLSLVLLFLLCCPYLSFAQSQRDILNPREFVRIYECPHDASRLNCRDINMVLSRSQEHGGIEEYVNAEVDVDSRIIIEFQRDFINDQKEAFEADISISGELEGANGTRNIEIPGYNLIGEESRSASARIRSATDLISIINDISKLSEEMKVKLREILKKGGVDSDETIEFQIGRLQLDKEDITRLQEGQNEVDIFASSQSLQELQNRRRRMDNKMSLLEMQISQIKDRLAELGNDQIQERINLTSEIDDLEIEKQITTFEIQETDINIRREEKRSELTQGGSGPLEKYKTLILLQQELLNKKAQIQILTNTLQDEDNRFLVRVLSRNLHAQRNHDLIIQFAKDIDERYEVISQDLSLEQLTSEKVSQAINAMRSVISLVADEFPEIIPDAHIQQVKDKVRDDLRRSLRDTSILLRSIEAVAGDNVTVSIQNSSTFDELPRTLHIRFVVRDFEWVRTLTDSFLFLRSVNAGKEINDVPIPKQFTPAAGASLIWTYHGRRGLGRVLEPGIGFNASFPVSGASIERLENQMENGDTAVGDPTYVLSEPPNQTVNFALGGMITLFDNSIQFTFGYNLTESSDKRRAYYGVGVSFVNLARRISP